MESKKEKFKGECFKFGKTGHMSEDGRSEDTSAFEADEELAETECIEMASVVLNALEIGAVQLSKRIIEFVLESIRVLQGFSKSVTDDNLMLDTPGQARSGCAKSPSQAQRRVSQIRNPESCGHAQSVDGGVRDERNGTRCLFPKERQRHQGVRVPREQWHETGARESELSVPVASRTCPIQPEYIEE